MNAEIIAVGSELLLGQIANTNAQFISKELAEMGINVYFHTVVGDNSERLESAIQLAKSRATLIIFTGGLGPTKDDLTKETISASLRKKLVYDQKALESIESYFTRTGRVMTENNRKQALVIEDSISLTNANGMAPGMVITVEDHTYILMPGPPSEMKPMFINYVKPYLQKNNKTRIVSRVLRFFGIGESALETRLMDLIDEQTNPTIAPLAKQGEVTLRLTANHPSKETAERLIDELEAKVLARVGEFFYGYGEVGLQEVTFNLLNEHKVTIAAAESLTGGLFSQELTSFSGASDILKGSVVTYTNEAKMSLLSIPKSILTVQGAVSEACALAMAENVREKLGVDIGISFTGVAGPSKSEGKEVGTVYIGLATKEQSRCFALKLSGTREAIRYRTMLHGFNIIRTYLTARSK